MSLDLENSFSSQSNLDLWYKVINGNELSLTDIPEIIKFRWTYFRDNWEFIKHVYVELIPGYQDPRMLSAHVDLFSKFIETQRISKSARNPFDNNNILYRFYTIFNTTLISNIDLSYEEKQIIINKTTIIKNYTRGDFLNIRNELQKERDQLADKTNTTDIDYNRVFKRSPQIGYINLKNKDLNKMQQLQQAIKTTDYILANSFSLETATIDPFALARANANNPNVDIQSYSSGVLMRLNYGEDLQALAKRTLDDPNKWIDIAITNGLKAPYIDEVGQRLPLISNADSNQINIAELDINGKLNIDKFYVGQVILLQSTTQTFPEQRSILNVIQVPISGELVIELNGKSDLGRYKLNENAYIRVFKSNTINSSFYIMIPSLNPLGDSSSKDIPWFLQGADGIEKKQKVDLFVNDKGDLDFNSTGDLQLSYGITNAMQAVKLKLSIEAGELRRHPEYGLISVAGTKNSNIATIKQTLISSITRLIRADERFANIHRLDVTYGDTLDNFKPNKLSIVLVVKLAGSGQLLPLSFTVNT